MLGVLAFSAIKLPLFIWVAISTIILVRKSNLSHTIRKKSLGIVWRDMSFKMNTLWKIGAQELFVNGISIKNTEPLQAEISLEYMKKNEIIKPRNSKYLSWVDQKWNVSYLLKYHRFKDSTEIKIYCRNSELS